MLTFKEFAESKKCPPGYKYDEKLKVCVPKFRKYAYYGRIGPGPKQDTSGDQGNGNGNGNAGNGNGNGATPGNGGNGGNGATPGNGGNGGGE